MKKKAIRGPNLTSKQDAMLTEFPNILPGGEAVNTAHSSDIHRFFINWHIQDRYV